MELKKIIGVYKRLFKVKSLIKLNSQMNKKLICLDKS